jgi:hypothetical protein
MYDDLARTQIPTPLEWFVVHAVIPSLVVTLAVQLAPSRRTPPLTTLATPPPQVEYVLFADQPVEVTSVPENELPFAEPYRCVESALLDDDTPVILRWTRAGDAAHLLHADAEGCVVLEAAVGPLGLVDPGSIVVVSATHRRLVRAARQTIIAHLRIIMRSCSQPMPAKVRVPFEFSAKE